MKRTVYECRACGGKPCRLVVIGDNKNLFPGMCPVAWHPAPAAFKKVSECEIPEVEEEESKEVKE